MFLTRYARSVTILVRSDDFTCAVATADLAKKHPKIKICYNTVVDEVAGGSILKTVSEEEIADEIIKLAEEYEKNTGRID